jgi:hypothetical protein
MKALIFFILLAIGTGLVAQSYYSYWDKYWTCGMLVYTDPEEDEGFWVITAGNTSKFFIIHPCSGIVQVDTMAYNSFVTQKTFTLKFKVTDHVGNSATTTRKIVLKKVNGVKQQPIMSDAL